MKDYNQLPIDELNQDMCMFLHGKAYDLVKYLLTSPELKHHADINTKHDYIFEHACKDGNIDFIKFILETPSLNRNVPLIDSYYEGMYISTSAGHLNNLKYFEKKLIDLKEDIDYNLLIHNTSLHDLNTFRYISEKYLQNNKYNDRDYELFSPNFHSNKLDLIQYFIFELNIPKTALIEKIIEKNSMKEKINKLFALRELNQNLNEDLIKNVLKIKSSKKNKI